MEKSLYSRNFEVNYYEIKENIWRATSHLRDDQHDIEVIVDVSVPDMVILDAKLELLRYPIKECILIKDKIKELIGVNIFSEFHSKCEKLFYGDMGCGNVRMLLGVSVPGIIYSYFPHQIKIGNMTENQWWDFCKQKLSNACIAHTLMSNKD
ncbi:Protein of unknown function [Clostridium cavendishii DSM 21758]|uniref:DUF2889 domain-containing protein n=1 Tax=Clostridium cavendishii DSM 21758 TaxID=1121302 RepID=A0A1M6JBT0_9CLOT|nr:DUF2889 domain-containing protein [Clostridium cavendishii]SHJ44178.1 Protein of unknown function [Clostridium cavendishii DSM 21758]